MAIVKPAWMHHSLPLEVYEELAKVGTCTYCMLRFISCRMESLYSMYEPELLNTLFPASLLIDTDNTDEDSVLRTRYRQLKHTLVHRKPCVVCLDALPPLRSFFVYLAQIIRSYDYEFDEFSHFKTLPGDLLTRQYGMWMHLRDIFPTVAYFQYDTYENHIVDFKEAMKYIQTKHIVNEMNFVRDIDNKRLPDITFEVAYKTDLEKDGFDPAQPVTSGNPYYVYPVTTPYPHIPSTEINKNPVTCTNTAPLKVYTIYYCEEPEYEDDLRKAIFATMKQRNVRTQLDVLGVGSLVRNLSKLSVATLKKLEIIPPRLPKTEASLVLAQGKSTLTNEQRSKLHHIQKAQRHAKYELKMLQLKEAQQNGGASGDGTTTNTEQITDNNHDTKKDVVYSPMICKPLDGIPLSIIATIDRTNGIPSGKIAQLTPYLTLEVTLLHDPILLQGNYIKLSRTVSHTSWYEAPKLTNENVLVIQVPDEYKTKPSTTTTTGTTTGTTTDTIPTETDTKAIADILNASAGTTERKKKKHEDLSDDDDDDEETSAGGAGSAGNQSETKKHPDLSDEYLDQGVFASSSVEAELSWRLVPYFWPGKGPGYEPTLLEQGKTYVLDDPAYDPSINPYKLQQYAGYTYKFHSSGREDLNVRMTGSGRPFFLEFMDPHRVPRLTPETLASFTRQINLHSPIVQVRNLEVGNATSFQAMVKGIGEKSKRYRCVVYCEQPLDSLQQLDKLKTDNEYTITQLTPLRVLYRRSAMARIRTVKILQIQPISPHWFMLDIETQAGTYVKEFVHSDRGRTFPSVTSILGVQCTITQLDVTDLIL